MEAPPLAATEADEKAVGTTDGGGPNITNYLIVQ